ncbi:hypothetical protein, partial [Xanthomonas arboricola]|uniref:hypothetical protein n=1 Tax=Xanthomonas arboricola TaxID=56448 RepID=UPI0019557694
CQQPLINFGAGDAGTCADATPRPCCLGDVLLASSTAMTTRVRAYGLRAAPVAMAEPLRASA